MKKYYVKSLKEFKNSLKLNEKKILASMSKLKSPKKTPTSIALEPTTITELKDLAATKGIPYQVLMRMFILEGLRRRKRAQ